MLYRTFMGWDAGYVFLAVEGEAGGGADSLADSFLMESLEDDSLVSCALFEDVSVAVDSVDVDADEASAAGASFAAPSFPASACAAGSPATVPAVLFW